MNSFGKSTIFVTGGAGFIGSHFIRHLFAAHPGVGVVNFDKLTYCGNPDNLLDVEKNRRYAFVKGDIGDSRAVDAAYKKYKPQYIINFAAESHVDRSIHAGAADFIRTNVHGVHALLDAARRAKGIRKFVQVSTDEIYGDLPLASKEKFTERSPLHPNSPYAGTKASGDLLALAYFRTFGMPVAVTRSGNNFGTHQYPEKLIPFFILRLLERKTLPLYGDGKNVRDWLHVRDHCRALEAVLLKGEPGEVYNIGAGNERPNHEIARRILSHFGASSSRIEFVADRPGHDRRYALDTVKIQRKLGWKPTAIFEEELAHTIQWYRESPQWIAGVKKRAKTINPHIV